MTIYAQANEKGYIVSTTDEELLSGLWGGKSRQVSKEAERIVKERLKKIQPVHLDDLADIEGISKN